MKIQQLFISFILLFTFNSLVAANEVDSILLSGVKNIYKVDDGIYRSSQPNKQQFLDLEKVGLNEVLNLRRYHSDMDEAKETNITLHHIKVRAEAFKEEHLINAMRILKNRKGNILIHCWHGSDRTGVVVAMYRIVFQDWTKTKAIEEMKNGGYGHHKIYSNLPRLIENIDIELFKKKLFEENGE